MCAMSVDSNNLATRFSNGHYQLVDSVRLRGTNADLLMVREKCYGQATNISVAGAMHKYARNSR